MLRSLIVWSLTSSEVIKKMIADSYKQTRQEGDQNQPLSVQPWGRDGDKRTYYLVEGKDDTSFRVYREKLLEKGTKAQWYSVAGSLEELKVLAGKLQEDGTQAARRLSDRITNALPRFEATEEVLYS